jgi:hypothetical protein
MSDAQRPGDSVEQLLALMARGVQRMADSFGSFEQRLAGLADADLIKALSDRTDEYRVRTRAELAQVAEALERLQAQTPARPVWVDELVARLGTLERKLVDRPAAAPGAVSAPDPAATEQVLGAVRGLRDEMAVALGELRAETTAAIERVIAEQSGRLTRLQDALATARAEPPSTARLEEVQRILDEVRDELRTVHGEIVSSAGQLRTDLAAEATVQRDRLVDAIQAVPIAEDRFASIERVIASLRDELAIDRLESSLRDMAEDTSGLRADVRRSFDRVLHEISTSEESLKGEVRAIDHRLSGFGEDLRLVRGLRDGLEALAAGVDSVRHLASRSATSSQMGELAADLSTVLAEIETARAQVLSVDQQVGRIQAGAIDLPATSDVTRSVEDLERTVTEEMADLGARIEELAERAVGEAPTDDPIGRRLRSLATSARQLGMGIGEDLKARRAAAKPKSRARKR